MSSSTSRKLSEKRRYQRTAVTITIGSNWRLRNVNSVAELTSSQLSDLRQPELHQFRFTQPAFFANISRIDTSKVTVIESVYILLKVRRTKADTGLSRRDR